MNILKHMSLFLLIGAVLVALPGARRKPKPVKFPSLPSIETSADYTHTKQGITLQAKRLNKPEAEQILGKRAGRLWQKKRLKQKWHRVKRRKTVRNSKPRYTGSIIPIQLSIKNQTGRPVAIRPKDIDLNLSDGKEIAKRLHRNPFIPALIALTAGAAIGVAVAATAAWAAGVVLSANIVAGILHTTASVSTAMTGLATCTSILSPFVIIGTPIIARNRAVKTTKDNRRMKNILDKNNLASTIQVTPGKTVGTLIFVAESDYKETFAINAQKGGTENAQPVPFTVALQTPSTP